MLARAAAAAARLVRRAGARRLAWRAGLAVGIELKQAEGKAICPRGCTRSQNLESQPASQRVNQSASQTANQREVDKPAEAREPASERANGARRWRGRIKRRQLMRQKDTYKLARPFVASSMGGANERPNDGRTLPTTHWLGPPTAN